MARLCAPAREGLHVLGRLLREDVEGLWVGLAVEVFVQGGFEEAVVGGGGREQGHAGSEFQIVRVGEDLVSTTPLHVENKLSTGSESWA